MSVSSSRPRPLASEEKTSFSWEDAYVETWLLRPVALAVPPDVWHVRVSSERNMVRSVTEVLVTSFKMDDVAEIVLTFRFGAEI